LAASARVFRTVDVFKRLAVVPPSSVRIVNHPVGRPVAVFNPALFLEGDELVVLARVVLGYYKYVSAIAEFRLGLSDVLEGSVPEEVEARVVIWPRDWHDFWGAEDPRGTVVDGVRYVVYTGRTKNYFSDVHERTVPVIAREAGGEWVKVGVVRHSRPEAVVSDKDAFIVREGGHYFLFHRPHYGGTDFRLAVSKISGLAGEVVVRGAEEVLKPAVFEEKIGWGTPPVEVGSKERLLILHGVDKDLKVYRAFAALMRFDGGEPELVGVSGPYVMEPREAFEVYGDRPMVVFPCGAVRVDDSVLVAYGAADQAVGFAVAKVSEVMDLMADVY